jgi:hypothetical protein
MLEISELLEVTIDADVKEREGKWLGITSYDP